MSHDELLALFFEESAELVADYDAGLLRLEAHPDDHESLNHVFRCAHSLKGGSAAMGFTAIVRLTHVIESLLDRLRTGRRAVTPDVVTLLLAATDSLRNLLTAARRSAAVLPHEGEAIERIVSAIELLVEEGSAIDAPAASAPPAGDAADSALTYEIAFRPGRDLLQRGLDPLRLLADLTPLGDVHQMVADLSSLPPLPDLDPEQCYLAWTFELTTRRGRDEIERCFEFVDEPGAVAITARPLGQEPSAPLPSGPSPHPTETTTLRVRVEQVDRLVNLVGELMTTHSMLAQTVAAFTPERLASLQELVWQMDRHVRELNEGVMRVRMVAVRALFSRFPRLVRDLSRATGKPVILEMSGEDTELDKGVIERITDPLTHLVRNAIDHGLEAGAERRASGKPEVGRVRLAAFQEGGSVYIEVADDGAGLDRDRIVARATDAGLVEPGAVLTDEEALALILRPGFSTADAITELSGRGVGMDVVTRTVDALRGSLSIRTMRGEGTRFRIQLPLTLAVMDGQVLQVGEQAYVLPLLVISESVRPLPGSVHAIPGGGEAIVVRGVALTMLRLHELFGITPASEEPTDGLAIIVDHEGRRTALLVDALAGQHQVVIKNLGPHLDRVEGVAGAAILGDGRVALILDVPGLIALARRRLAPAIAGKGGNEMSAQKRSEPCE